MAPGTDPPIRVYVLVRERKVSYKYIVEIGRGLGYRINGLSSLTSAQRSRIEDALDGPPEDQGAGVPAKPPRGPSLGEAARNK